MRKLYSLLALFLALHSTVFSQTASDLFSQASDLFDKKDYTQTIAIINKALLKDSTNSLYYLLKGNAYWELGKDREAFNAYTAGLQVNEKDPSLYNQRGLIFKKFGQTDNAIQEFTTALLYEKRDTLRAGLFVNRGAGKIDIRDFQGAYDDFIEAYKLDSLNIGTLNNLATVCDETGRGAQTFTYLYKILAIDSTFIGAYANIGYKYQEMGDHKKAIEFYNKVLALDPKEPLGYSNRAYNLYKTGKLSAALTDINSSIKLYPTNSYAFRIRALIYLSLKQKDKACGDLSEALRLGFTKMYGDEVEKLKREQCDAKSL